ncbi:histidine kinase [Methyloprofundus sedimenti]|uniref:histidine kinase n=1 Tax=Methyloprofundus sedimenti TaxID=1420851 RepID=A0A1V8M911_9GAMM|nr:histidine kinase [Methyloprofundus sedimenti]OQK18110.1 histidine kinase [Methyloprofundus sedimenti]
MNLKFHLLLRITLVALFCLLGTASYVLYQADRQAKQEAQALLDSVTQQLHMQLLRIDAGFGQANKFPDLSLWQETSHVSGVCLRFITANNGFTRGLCRGAEWPATQWPRAFAIAYQWLFNPGLEIKREITFKGRKHGALSLTPSAEKELARAWENLRVLLTLSAFTIVAVCLLVYLSIRQALRPAQVIVTGLKKMQSGDLTVRLPDFKLLEWQQTATAINDLASSQQQLLNERKQLTYKLITLQDQERRYLARELHDELGQCLAAINALAASITQTAEQECPVLVDEAKNISRINDHIMQTVRELLVKLRPAEVDELGLEASLNSLLSEWNTRAGRKIHYCLMIKGDCAQLAEPLPMTLFRLIQEGITNIAKHAHASSATIELTINSDRVTLTISDNGSAELPFKPNSGMGLLGMRERVSALGGQLNLENNKSGGLRVHITIPLQKN